METPVVVSVSDVSKRFVINKNKSLKEQLVNFRRSQENRDQFWALHNVDLDIRAGSSVGLIGPNGSGKSTLLKVIGGIIEPTSGNVRRRGRLAALLELGAGFHPDLTGRENVYLNGAILGLSKSQINRYFDHIVSFSGIEKFIDTQVKFYSSGMYVRLAFAVAVHVDPDVLLVDEVLAVGDEPFQQKCMDRIRTFQKEGRTIVLVSHALDTVADVCNRAVVLQHGEVQFDGDPRRAARVLRNDYDVTRQEDLARAASQSEEVPEVEIEHVELLDLNGIPAKLIESGQSVMVRVTIKARKELTDWMLGIGVDTMSGQAIWGTHTQLLGRVLPDLATGEETTVEFKLDNLYLGPGQFAMHAAVARYGGAEIARRPQATSFMVETDGSTVGMLGIRAQLR